MAITALKKTAQMKEVTKPEAANCISSSSYMDDICTSTDNVQQAKQLTRDIDEILDAGGFKVKKWVYSGLKDEENEKTEVTLGAEEAEEKVLGVVWIPQEDKFTFKVKLKLGGMDLPMQQSHRAVPVKLTKRIVLSKLASAFDPIGAAAPVTIKAKVAMQELWQLGISWDDELPQSACEKWVTLLEEMTELNLVEFDRSLTPDDAVDKPSLVIFCDASRQAFGACAYVRWLLNTGTFGVKFVAAKSRVAPLKELSIPRLELQAAVMVSRLAKSIREETRFDFESVQYFSDSRVVIAWIQGPSRTYKPFTSVRVGEIQSVSDPSEWMYCPTQLNVADDLTKGIQVKDMKGRWLSGPDFLRLPREFWPTQPGTPDMEEVRKERRKVLIVNAAVVTEQAINPDKFSSWQRLIRVTAYVFRFCKNVRRKRDPSGDPAQRCLGPLTVEEIKEAEDHLVKQAQLSLHQQLEKGDFKTLTPFVDKKGIIRVGGRVDPALVSYDIAHPALLPHKHRISVLIVEDEHRRGHVSVAATVAKTRRKYWIIRMQSIAKSIKLKCTVCRKNEACAETQFMADLPEIRQQPLTPPFLFTSVDYFGPLKVKVNRRTTEKHYGIIFTCLNTRAVHCEMGADASTMELLQVLRRFFAYRGYPQLLLSENGSQMIGAERELKQMIKGWDVEKLKEYCADRSMKWQFTTPLAPHQNGCVESMVKSVKLALKKAIGDTILKPFELYTCLLEVANIVNERPIGRLPGDPDDGSYLCPNDILLGRASNRVPQGPFRETRNPRHRFEFCQRIVDAFWKKWSRDALPQLILRKKWNTQRRNVQVNDYVIVSDPNAVRGKWNTGRIIEVYPGADGLVRNVKVRTKKGEYQRPITKISVIYPAEGFQD